MRQSATKTFIHLNQHEGQYSSSKCNYWKRLEAELFCAEYRSLPLLLQNIDHPKTFSINSLQKTKFQQSKSLPLAE